MNYEEVSYDKKYMHQKLKKLAENNFLENKKPNQLNYKHFEKEYRESTKNLANYIIQNKIKNLVLIDSSARLAYIGVREYIKKKSPELMPNIYFTSQTGYEEFRREDKSEITYELKNKYKKLFENRKLEKTLLFDTCIHSGKSITPIIKQFKNVGFKNLQIGVFHEVKDGKLKDSIDFISYKNNSINCYPYDRDYNLVRTKSIISSYNYNDSIHNKRRVELRRYLKNLVKEN